MLKSLKLMITVVLFGALLLSVGQAQDTSTYDIDANVGRVAYLPLDDVINRTGLRAWVSAGFTGAGQNIGILHRSFTGLDSLIPDSITVETNFISPSETDSTQTLSDGAESFELISQIAPDANYFLCDYATLSEFASCVTWFITQNIHVVHHGTGIYAPSNILSEFLPEVERAVRADIVWINAAGNVASGTVRGFITLNDNVVHQFRINNSTQLSIEPISDTTRVITLVWQGDTNRPANVIDLDLEILDNNGNLLMTSNNVQTGNPDDLPLEIVSVPSDVPFSVQIRNIDGLGEGIPFVLSVEFGTIIGNATMQSIVLPATSADVISVGALQGSIIAPYSSQGPTESGAIKPDLATFAEIQLDGSQIFGTGMSSAVVVGAATLVRQANSEWTQQQVSDFLISSTQDDRQIEGVDTLYGYGRLFLLPPGNPVSTPTLPGLAPPLSATEIGNLPVNFPGGQRVVFTRNQMLWLLDEMSSVQALNLNGNSYDPDIVGSTIVYASARDGQRLNVYSYNIDTVVEQQLTTHDRQDRHPALSPDGSQIAFSSDRDGNWEIYLMNVDGSNPRRITNSQFTEYAPSWSPDGQSLIFQTDQVDFAPVTRVNLNTGAITSLTNSQLNLVGAIMSPDGNSVATYTLTDNPRVVVIDVATGRTRESGDGIPGGWFDSNHVLVHRREANDTINTYLVNVEQSSYSLAIENASWAASSR